MSQVEGIDAGVEAGCGSIKNIVVKKTPISLPPLLQAVQDNNEELVTSLIESGIDINQKDNYGRYRIKNAFLSFSFKKLLSLCLSLCL